MGFLLVPYAEFILYPFLHIISVNFNVDFKNYKEDKNMIINRGYEAIQEIGTKKVGLEGLIRTADEMETKWNDDFVSGYQAFPLMLTKDGDVQYLRNGSETVKADLTENAFSQICQRAGVPSVYMRKCLDSGRGELAAENFSSWAQHCNGCESNREACVECKSEWLDSEGDEEKSINLYIDSCPENEERFGSQQKKERVFSDGSKLRPFQKNSAILREFQELCIKEQLVVINLDFPAEGDYFRELT